MDELDLTNNSVAGYESDYGAWAGATADPMGYASIATDSPATPDAPAIASDGWVSGYDLNDATAIGKAPADEFDPASGLADSYAATDSLGAYADGGNGAIDGTILDARDAMAAGTAAGRGAVTLSTNGLAGGASGVNRTGIEAKPPSNVNTTGGVMGFLNRLSMLGKSGAASTSRTATATQVANARSKPGAALAANARAGAGSFNASLPMLAGVGLLAYLATKG